MEHPFERAGEYLARFFWVRPAGRTAVIGASCHVGVVEQWVFLIHTFRHEYSRNHGSPRKVLESSIAPGIRDLRSRLDLLEKELGDVHGDRRAAQE